MEHRDSGNNAACYGRSRNILDRRHRPNIEIRSNNEHQHSICNSRHLLVVNPLSSLDDDRPDGLFLTLLDVDDFGHDRRIPDVYDLFADRDLVLDVDDLGHDRDIPDVYDDFADLDLNVDDVRHHGELLIDLYGVLIIDDVLHVMRLLCLACWGRGRAYVIDPIYRSRLLVSCCSWQDVVSARRDLSGVREHGHTAAGAEWHKFRANHPAGAQ